MMAAVVGFKLGGAGSRELDSDCAHAETGDPHGFDSGGGRPAHCVLAELLSLALEVPG